MRMTSIEKLLVNRQSKGAANVRRIRNQLVALGLEGPHETLELGSGAGDVSAALARELGHSVTGTDLDSAQIALARSRHGDVPGVEFAVADATALEFPDGRFDLVVAQNMFHHVPAWRDVVAEVARVLRVGGHLLWLDLTLPPRLARVLAALRHRVGVYTLGDVREAFRRSGLEPVTVTRLGGWPSLRHELAARKRGG